MRKVFSNFILLVIIIFAVGCGANNSGTNMISGTNPNNGNNVQQSKLNNYISTSAAVAKNGRLVVLATNGNSIPVDMEIEVEFYSESGEFVGSDEENFIAVGANANIAVEMYNTPTNWDSYKIYVDVEETQHISFFDMISIKHSNNRKEIAVQVTNNSDSIIDYISVAVVYYQDDNIVGINDDIEYDIKPGRNANFDIGYAYDKKYNDVKFNSYKVFVTEAYSSDY